MEYKKCRVLHIGSYNLRNCASIGVRSTANTIAIGDQWYICGCLRLPQVPEIALGVEFCSLYRVQRLACRATLASAELINLADVGGNVKDDVEGILKSPTTLQVFATFLFYITVAFLFILF